MVNCDNELSQFKNLCENYEGKLIDEIESLPLHIVGDNNDGGKLVYKHVLDVPDQTGLLQAHLCSIMCAKSLFLQNCRDIYYYIPQFERLLVQIYT